MENDISKQLGNVLRQYQQELDTSLERALDECTEQYIDELERTAPREARGKSSGKPYHKSFVVKDSIMGMRFVGNSKMVKGATRETIPLINLLEYGRGPEGIGARPHMNDALSRTADKMVQVIAEKLERVK